MAGKRKWETFDPNKSDSDDLDYGAAASSSPRGTISRASIASSKARTRKPLKRRRETYEDSEGEIEADSDEDVSDEGSFGRQSE